MGKTITEKIFDAHRVEELAGGIHVLRLDAVFCHEITTPIAITDLEAKLTNAGNPYAYHISTELALLENLENVPQIEGPKFVFAHIVLTHGPYVFMPDGTITSDPNFSSHALFVS